MNTIELPYGPTKHKKSTWCHWNAQRAERVLEHKLRLSSVSKK